MIELKELPDEAGFWSRTAAIAINAVVWRDSNGLMFVGETNGVDISRRSVEHLPRGQWVKAVPHQADDGEPINEAWLRIVGWIDWPDKSEFAEFDLYLPLPDEIGWECRLAYQSNGIYAVRMCDRDEREELVSESVELFGSRNTTRTVTRGQVRKLVAALGLERMA